jgi:hypothetical protein
MYCDVFVAVPFSEIRVSRLNRHSGGIRYIIRRVCKLIKDKRQSRIGRLMRGVVERLAAVQSLHGLRQGHSNDRWVD